MYLIETVTILDITLLHEISKLRTSSFDIMFDYVSGQTGADQDVDYIDNHELCGGPQHT